MNSLRESGDEELTAGQVVLAILGMVVIAVLGIVGIVLSAGWLATWVSQ